jgi:hypothetical protein
VDSLFYLASLIGIVWLCFWTVRDQRKPSQRWSPFDLKADEPAAPPVADRRPGGALRRRRDA